MLAVRLGGHSGELVGVCRGILGVPWELWGYLGRRLVLRWELQGALRERRGYLARLSVVLGRLFGHLDWGHGSFLSIVVGIAVGIVSSTVVSIVVSIVLIIWYAMWWAFWRSLW